MLFQYSIRASQFADEDNGLEIQGRAPIGRYILFLYSK